jgi:hypothetical protein
VDASRSERSAQAEDGAEPQRSWSEALLSLDGSERLAAIGALVCAGSIVLPWYSAPVDDLVKTGFGAFGFAHAALLITAGSALLLMVQGARGRRPLLPLREGTLVIAAGIWAALIVVFLTLDRPQFELGTFREDYDLGYGIFVALGGAVLMVLSGLRLRRVEIIRERRRG